MKKIIFFLQLFWCSHLLSAQVGFNLFNSYNIDSLKNLLVTHSGDSTKPQILFQIVIFYLDNNLDSSLKYVKEFNQIPSKSTVMQANGLNIMGDIYLRLGNASKSLETLLKALKIEETLNDPWGMSMLYWNIGKVYQSQDDNTKAISYYLQSLKLSSSVNSADSVNADFVNNGEGPKRKALISLGKAYINLNQLDSALYYTKSADEIIIPGGDKTDLAYISTQLGNIYQESGNPNLALNYYRKALKEAIPIHNFSVQSDASISIALLLKNNNETDSSYYYAMQAFAVAEQLKNAPLILKASNFLKDFFKDKNRLDSAFKYQEIMISAKDSMLSLEKIKKVQSIYFEEKQHEQEIKTEKKEYQNKVKLYVLVISLAVFLFFAVFLYKNNRQKQKANLLLQQQKQKVETTLEELKSAQQQLIQSEKMASLGELTAGIAHEIQNPLNFVNNFSEINKELLVEMKDEMNKGNIDDANEIANDVIDNEEKINHHGKRADAIVKGMLQHSRTSTGVKEPTDINKLADEYLRLSYHGLRAKDKSFNAIMKTDFDHSIGKINVVSQDIGRVLLNLYNNAFYAISKRQDAEGKEYEPSVSVSTKKEEKYVIITVKDNGGGISEKIKEKIFQPFFTTKPTGSGTGLGLSLSYDIVKAHGGEIKVESKEGEGTGFIIELPI